MKHVMLDIETMGTGMNACVVAVGAFKFDKDTDFKESLLNSENCFYELPHWEGEMDYATVQWWLTQTTEAREAISTGPAKPLYHCLVELVSFVGNCNIWGNGVDFDNAIIQSHIKRLGIKGWSYKNNRCFRTVKNMYGPLAYTKPAMPHHALHDAIAQAETLVSLSKQWGIPL
jgi:hypothetical protein